MNLRDCSTDELAALLASMGCPKGKSGEMAGQLDKRARQLSEQKSKTYDEALLHLLNLMKQGWAAQARLGSNPPDSNKPS